MPRFMMHPLRSNNILALYQQRELINLDPPYQRLSVWDKEKQQCFVDSLINGIDTPKIYFHDLAGQSGLSQPFRFSVIDGKQRMLALWAFISNEISLRSDFVYFHDESLRAGGATYDRLLDEFPLLRAKFDNYAVPVVLVKAEGDEFIEQLFYRLNIQVQLSAPEHRNMMGGPLPLLIRKIGLTRFFKESLRTRNTRFQHLDLAAKFLYISHTNDFVPTKKINLDNFVMNMRSAQERESEIASPASLQELEDRTSAELERTHSFFGQQNPLLQSVGRTILYFHIFRLCSKAGQTVPLSVSMLEKFNADVTLARHKSQRMSMGSQETLTDEENDLVRFDQEKQSLNDGGPLERQYEYLRKYLTDHYSADLPSLS